MMDAIAQWAAMGGYAVWVWSAYGVAAVALAGMLVASLMKLRRREAEIAQSETRRRRRDAGTER